MTSSNCDQLTQLQRAPRGTVNRRVRAQSFASTRRWCVYRTSQQDFSSSEGPACEPHTDRLLCVHKVCGAESGGLHPCLTEHHSKAPLRQCRRRRRRHQLDVATEDECLLKHTPAPHCSCKRAWRPAGHRRSCTDLVPGHTSRRSSSPAPGPAPCAAFAPDKAAKSSAKLGCQHAPLTSLLMSRNTPHSLPSHDCATTAPPAGLSVVCIVKRVYWPSQSQRLQSAAQILPLVCHVARVAECARCSARNTYILSTPIESRQHSHVHHRLCSLDPERQVRRHASVWQRTCASRSVAMADSSSCTRPSRLCGCVLAAREAAAPPPCSRTFSSSSCTRSACHVHQYT